MRALPSRGATPPLRRSPRPVTLAGMTRPPPKPPAQAEDRAARLAAALRENLKRRKAQARARDAAADQPPAPAKVAGEKPMG